jgi:membrane associated rhomboid family serine protease
VFPLRDNIPTERFPVVTVTLIALNVLAFFLFQRAGISFGGADVDHQRVIEYGAIPYELTNPGQSCATTAELSDGQVVRSTEQLLCEGQTLATGAEVERVPEQPPAILTVFSSMFMHGGLLHIAGNMLFLWIFGNNVEDSMGRLRFVAFYGLAGIAALTLQVAFSPDAAVPTIGASGAVAGVLGGYLLLYPHARVVTVIFIVFFFTIIELPAVLILGLWFLQQLVFGYLDFVQPTAGGGVAYFAHVGGFVFGMLAIKVFAQRRKSVPPRYPVY